MRRAVLRALAPSLALVVLACGDEGRSPPSYSGSPGQPTPLTIDRGIPWVEAVVGSRTTPLLLDTGSPLTVLGGQAAAGTPAGRSALSLQAFGLSFPRLEVVVLGQPVDLSTPCDGVQGQGQLGHDLVGHFRLRLDYREGQGALFDTTGDGTALAPETAAVVTVPFDLLGGGSAQLAGIDPLRVPASRVVVETTVEGVAGTALVDTGSTLTLLSQRLLSSLPETGRPRACCIALRLPTGTVNALLVRLGRLQLGGASSGNLVAAVLSGPAPFDALSAETGREIEMILGGSFLRLHALEIDYPASRLRLATYQPASHIDPDEYLLPGFSFCRSGDGDGMLVVTVFEATDAAAQGVTPGARFTAVDGTPVATLGATEVLALMHQRADGDSLRITFATGQGTTEERLLRLQRVLPDYR